MRRNEFDHNSPEARDHLAEYYAPGGSPHGVFRTDSWGGCVVAGDYATLRSVAGDPAGYRSGPGVLIPPIGHQRRLLPMESDGVEHQAFRRRLLAALSPKAVAHYEPAIEATVVDALNALEGDDDVDVYALAKIVPARATAVMLGIEPSPQAWQWVDTLVYGRLVPARRSEVLRAARGIYEFFEAVLRNWEPRRDSEGPARLIDLLVRPDAHGNRLSRDELLDHCFFLLIAGLENTAFAIRAVLWHLGTHVDDRSALLEDPQKVRPFLEECLRMYSPVHGLARTSQEDAVIAGEEVRRGDRVLLAFAGANRDETVFPDANHFDVQRRANPHVAFGSGAHRCLGSNLARLELRITASKLLELFPRYQVAPGQGWHPAGPLMATLGTRAAV
jgi:cytochrome P450